MFVKNVDILYVQNKKNSDSDRFRPGVSGLLGLILHNPIRDFRNNQSLSVSTVILNHVC